MPDPIYCPQCQAVIPLAELMASGHSCPAVGGQLIDLVVHSAGPHQSIEPSTQSTNPDDCASHGGRLVSGAPITLAGLPLETSGRLPHVPSNAQTQGTSTSLPGDESRYAVREVIGKGGMGTVLKVLDTKIYRMVAMKILRGAIEPRQVDRFIEEAQVTGQLEHPNIVSVHELGTDRFGRPFFTMKLVKGRNLRQVLKPDPDEKDPGLGSLLTTFVNICNAVAFAHSRQVLHRDLKPANIMLGDFGEVQVMDWGLAKIIGSSVSNEQSSSQMIGQSPEVNDGSDSVRSSRRDSETDLTQDGKVMGTPMYMSPEQARGHVSKLDERSDIYSLGAILYEILTRLPPIDGKTVAMQLNQVTSGQIIPPIQRTPQRHIPRELSAITMKAMATKPINRYQTVAALRHDIERFLEGRSVSVKQDTGVEHLIKWVKRNPSAGLVASIALCVLVGVVAVFTWRLIQERDSALAARAKAEQALAELDQEQAQRRALERQSAKKYLEEAIQWIEKRQIQNALVSARIAAAFNPDLIEAHMLVAEILLVQQDWNGAERSLQAAMKNSKANLDEIERMLVLCQQGRRDGDETIAQPLIQTLQEHRQFLLADRLDQSGKDRLQLLRAQIDMKLPGSGKYLSIESDGKVTFAGMKNLSDLTFLKGIPLSRLESIFGSIVSLAPLVGMPLESIDLRYNRIVDLSPLKAMPLRKLDVSGNVNIISLAPLKNLPLMSLGIMGLRNITDFSALMTMPLESLIANGVPVSDLKPLMKLPLKNLSLYNCKSVRDFTPLIGLPLNQLNVSFTTFSDLSLLNNLPLQELLLRKCRISDLRPLTGMPLTTIDLKSTNVTDLSPLTDMPLNTLSLIDTEVTDFTPLKKMKLTSCSLAGTAFEDVSILADMPLHYLDITNCARVNDLTALQKVPLITLYMCGTSVTDLTPLAHMKLESLRLTPMRISKGMEVIRSMNSLGKIDTDQGSNWSAADFWAKYDQQELK